MKARNIRKNKYIIVTIALALIFSIGISFCAWDNNSISNKINSSTAAFFTKPQYKLVEDKDKNNVASVGDIVTFGNYYQSSTDNSKTPLRWIVVDKQNKELVLLTESIVAVGSFYNGTYVDINGEHFWDDPNNRYENQNFMESKLAKWLNSDYSKGNETLVPFSKDAEKIAMRGFMNEAFTQDEIDYIVPRQISGIKGYDPNIYVALGEGNNNFHEYRSAEFKVWVPSWSEVFGTTDNPYGTISDGFPNKQFGYFQGVTHDSNNDKPRAKSTSFASTPSKSNYSTAKDTSHKINFDRYNDFVIGDKLELHWWLRSPRPDVFAVSTVCGYRGGYGQTSGVGGVRPAVCVQV